jgi:DNA polymerase-3 subunit delta'
VSAQTPAFDAPGSLPGIEAHPHARAVLTSALRSSSGPSHAYLFHGPHGAGKRAVARGFAAALLAEGAPGADEVAARVARGSHPDLTWVTPSGAAEMLVADVAEPVVAAAARTPFESARRVFVIEEAHTLNDQAANRMLKTLEEPPDFVHLLLLTDRLHEVLPTIASRCQHVRFDPPAPASIVKQLKETDSTRAQACARLALGDTSRAAELCSEQGGELRAAAQAFAGFAIASAGDLAERPWLALLAAAGDAAAAAGEDVRQRVERELELLPAKERRRHEREGVEAQRRLERRARTRTLDLALSLVELWLRDVLCVCEGAHELIHALDRAAELERHARGCDPARVRRAIDLVRDARLSFALNVSEELALEALAYRLQAVLGGAELSAAPRA